MPVLHSGNLYTHRPELRTLYQLDFVAWYVDRWKGKESDLIWSLHEGYEGHTWDGTPDPLFHIVQNLTDGIHTACQAATGVGKTWLQSLIVYWHLDVFREARILTVGESEKGLERTLWDEEIRPKFPRFKKLVPNAYAYKEMRIIGDDQDLNEAEDVVNWQVLGIGVRKRSGDQSAGALQGVHGERFLIMIDEAAKVDPSVVTAAVNTSSDPETNLVFAFGNPDNQLDSLYQFGDYPHVDRVRISALDFPNVVTGRKIIPGATTRDSIAIRERKYGKTGPMYKSRVRGISPENSATTLLSRSTVMSRMNFQPTISGQFAGIDVANSENGDEAAVVFLKGNQISYIKSFLCPNANAIALNLEYSGEELREKLTKDDRGRDLPEALPDYDLPLLDDYGIYAEDTGVDMVGVGVGTINEFKRLGKQVFAFIAGGTVMNDSNLNHLIEYDDEGRPLETFANLRTLAFYLTKRDFENGELGFSPDIPKHIVEQAAKEGSAYRTHQSSGTGSAKHIQLESKDKMRTRLMNQNSPNIFDALCIANLVRHMNGYGTSSQGAGIYETDIPG